VAGVNRVEAERVPEEVSIGFGIFAVHDYVSTRYHACSLGDEKGL
jgi:hypothetical protein